MKANTFRRPCPPNMVRIIRTIEDSDQDRFITHAECNHLLSMRRLRKIRLGNDYPNSYQEVHNDQSSLATQAR